MEFWGVEVKAGETLKVSPGEGKVIHLSQAAIGDSKKGNNENVPVYVKVEEQKLVIGTLSAGKFPQIQYDIVFEQDFELSHDWKNGSVFFCGYKTQNPVDYSGDEFESDSESEDEELTLENGKPTPPALSGPPKPSPLKAAKIEDNKPDSDEDSSDEDDSDDESDDDEMDADDSSEDEDDSSEEEKEEVKTPTPTPKKDDKKRPAEAQNQATVSAKKAKFAAQKTDGKKPAPAAHTSTPHPTKQAGKNQKFDNSKSPKFAGKSHSNAKRGGK